MKVYKFKFDYFTDKSKFRKGEYLTEKGDDYYVNNNPFNSFYKKFVENNPDIFEECTKEWLLKEAKKRYPIGTKIKSLVDGKIKEVEGSPQFSFNGKDLICNTTSGGGAYLSMNNKWAEVVREPLFTTEDGVDIYEGDEVWMIIHYKEDYRNIHHFDRWGKYFGDRGKPIPSQLAFSSEENAKEALSKLEEDDEMYSVREIKDAFDRLNSEAYPFDLDITAEQLIEEMKEIE